MTDMPPPRSMPMGHLDAFNVGEKKLTVQTEFFPRPTWRVETKIYFAGALKKVHTADLQSTPESELQQYVTLFHQQKLDELAGSLSKRKSES
jgi:hypothetical protein